MEVVKCHRAYNPAMAEKVRHLGMWWCGCGHTEPRPPLSLEERAQLEWWRANSGKCLCPEEATDAGRIQIHADACRLKREKLRLFSETVDADELWARSHHEARKECPECGFKMVPARGAGRTT